MSTIRRQILRPFSPFVETVRNYRGSDFPRDLVAGLTVSVVDLPQSMAFAIIAGVPPIYGLYTSIVLAFLGALFTSSPYLSVGPTNTQSLIIAAVVSRLTNDPEMYLRLVIGLSLLKGLIQLAFAAARMGHLVRYVSQSAMIGFTAGAGVLIFMEQVPTFLGLGRTQTVEHLPGILSVVGTLAPRLREASLHSILIGLGSLAVVIASRRASEKLPGPLLAVAGGALAVWLLGWSDVPVIAELPRALPGFRMPRLTWQEAELLLPGAVAIAVLGMLESVAIAKSIARRTGQTISADQEFFGQGFANFVGSFFQCIPGSGSFSRTALQYSAGARTRVASIVRSASNAIMFLAFAPMAHHIPLASLAAILFYVAYKLVDVTSIWRTVRTSRSEATVCAVTLASSLLVPLTYAIYVGIFLSFAMYLRQASRLRLLHMVMSGEGEFVETPARRMEEQQDEVVLLQLQGDLFFGVADELDLRLRELAHSSARVAVFRLKRTLSVDATVLFTLEQFIRSMHARDAHVIFCGVTPELRRVLRRFGIEQLVGEGNVLETTAGVFRSTKDALARAQEMIEEPDSVPSDGEKPSS